MPPRRQRIKSTKSTTIMFKGGRIAASEDELLQRIFWRSQELALEAKIFLKAVIKSEPIGIPVSEWRKWIQKRPISLGQFYNMIKGLTGSGLIEKREGAWHLSTGFLRELEQMVVLYSAMTGIQHRLK